MNPLWRAALNRLLGDAGERAAIQHLRGQGFRIITRNYRNAAGEIDFIAREGEILVFVEVKTRRSGQPVEAVNLEKQRRLARAALVFLRRYRLLDHRWRFDVVAVVWPDDRRAPAIEHYRNAFETPDHGQFFS